MINISTLSFRMLKLGGNFDEFTKMKYIILIKIKFRSIFCDCFRNSLIGVLTWWRWRVCVRRAAEAHLWRRLAGRVSCGGGRGWRALMLARSSTCGAGVFGQQHSHTTLATRALAAAARDSLPAPPAACARGLDPPPRAPPAPLQRIRIQTFSPRAPRASRGCHVGESLWAPLGNCNYAFSTLIIR